MASPAGSEEDRQEGLKQRIAAKEALKDILRKYNSHTRERILAAVNADLDME